MKTSHSWNDDRARIGLVILDVFLIGFAKNPADDRAHLAFLVGTSFPHCRRKEEVSMRQVGVEENPRKNILALNEKRYATQPGQNVCAKECVA